MGDDLLKGGAHIQMVAEMQAQEELRQKENKTYQQLKDRREVLKIINEDDIIRAIRHFAKLNYNAALTRLLDPTKRNETDTTENLRAETHAHHQYVLLFDEWEKEGKDALKRLVERENISE